MKTLILPLLFSSFLPLCAPLLVLIVPRRGHLRGHAGLAAVETLSPYKQGAFLRSQMVHPRDHEENNPTTTHRSRDDGGSRSLLPRELPLASPTQSPPFQPGLVRYLPDPPLSLLTREGACPLVCLSPLLGCEHLGQRMFPNLNFYSLQLRLCSAVLGSQR